MQQIYIIYIFVAYIYMYTIYIHICTLQKNICKPARYWNKNLDKNVASHVLLCQLPILLLYFSQKVLRLFPVIMYIKWIL